MTWTNFIICVYKNVICVTRGNVYRQVKIVFTKYLKVSSKFFRMFNTSYNIMYCNVLAGRSKYTPRDTFPERERRTKTKKEMWNKNLHRYTAQWIAMNKHVLWEELSWDVEILTAVLGGAQGGVVGGRQGNL
jgi:hypothetical protein